MTVWHNWRWWWPCTLTPCVSFNWTKSNEQHTRDKSLEGEHSPSGLKNGTLSTSRAMAGILLPTSMPSQNPLADKITLWKAAVNKTDGAPCFSHHTTTTALGLTEGHVFTADYTRQFRLDIPDSSEEENHCLGSFPNHFHHILHDCPWYREVHLSAEGHQQWDNEFTLYYFCDFQAHDNSLISYRCHELLSCPHSRQWSPLNQDDCPDHPQTWQSTGCTAHGCVMKNKNKNKEESNREMR